MREATVGNVPTDDRTLMARVKTLLPAPNGSLIVLDIPQALRTFSPGGTFSHYIGRVGSGPGEFQYIYKIGLLRDTLWISDNNLRRTTLLRLDGSVISTTPWENVGAADAGQGARAINGLFADGTAWGEDQGYMAATLSGEAEPPKPVLRMTRSGRVLDTLAMVPTAHTMYAVVTGPGVSTWGAQPFADAPLVLATSSQSRVYVVQRGAPADARRATIRVVALNAKGDTAWNRSIPYQPRPLEKSVADSFLNRVLRSTARSGVLPDRVRNALFIPKFRAPVTSAFVSEDGQLWLRHEEGLDTVEHTVMSGAGEVMGTVALPRRVTLMAARGSQVWGIEKDADDVPSVVRYRLTK